VECRWRRSAQRGEGVPPLLHAACGGKEQGQDALATSRATATGGRSVLKGLPHGERVGIVSLVPQRGHLALRPAYRAGTFILLPQVHMNRMPLSCAGIKNIGHSPLGTGRPPPRAFRYPIKNAGRSTGRGPHSHRRMSGRILHRFRVSCTSAIVHHPTGPGTSRQGSLRPMSSRNSPWFMPSLPRVTLVRIHLAQK
jgi:hypothetical protein